MTRAEQRELMLRYDRALWAHFWSRFDAYMLAALTSPHTNLPGRGEIVAPGASGEGDSGE